MIESTVLSLYIGALIVVYISPGPDMALILASSASRGRRVGFSIARGFAIARAIHVLGSGAGLAVLFTAYPSLQTVIRVMGAIYLLHWAWKIARSPVEINQPTAPDPASGSDMWRGFLTNLLNPKAVLFCSMLLPQFVSAENGPLMPQFVLLGAVLVAVGLFFDISFAFLADWLTRSVSRNMSENVQVRLRAERIRNYLMVTVLGGMAVLLLKY